MRTLLLLVALAASTSTAAAQGFFIGCGTLQQGATCVLFAADAGGTFVLDNLGGFTPGQYVEVGGLLDPSCVSICQQGNGCIVNNTIQACFPGGGQPFSGCGLLQQGVTCVLFSADIGGDWILQDLGGFQPGTRVQVDGILTGNCFTICGEGNGCIFGNTIAPCTPFTSSCAGDGLDLQVTTPCPCGNFGATGRGCANSAEPAGALLTASGTPAADSVVLHGSGMPAIVGAIYFKGDARFPAATVFGDGLRCADGFLIRLGTKINVGGASQYPEAGDLPLSVRGQTPVGSGLVATYQVHYRNAAPLFCPPATFNASNALSVTW